MADSRNTLFGIILNEEKLDIVHEPKDYHYFINDAAKEHAKAFRKDLLETMESRQFTDTFPPMKVISSCRISAMQKSIPMMCSIDLSVSEILLTSKESIMSTKSELLKKYPSASPENHKPNIRLKTYIMLHKLRKKLFHINSGYSNQA